MESLERDWVEIALGPVIGLVTNDKARILVKYKESNKGYQTEWNIKKENGNPNLEMEAQKKYVTCCLRGENGERKMDRRPLQVGVAMTFAFQDLEPGVRYFVNLGCKLSMDESSFCTLGKQPYGTLRTGVVSCNEISIQEKKNENQDLWADLARRVRNRELDYLFHIGDQVYMDLEGSKEKRKTVYDECYEVLKSTGGNVSEEVRELVRELIREQYDRTWRDPSVAYVLANVPNLMICDDHEFRDDWGFRDEDSQLLTPDNDYGEEARLVYYEYQRQLRENIPWDNLKSLKCEYHHHILNGIGVCFIEYRGCRSWFKEEGLEKTHLGEAQQRWLRSLFEEGGEFQNVSSAIFITPLPLFLLNNSISKGAYWINKITSLLTDDVQEQWTYDALPQLEELLNLLRRWKKGAPDRELLVVGGDFHLGGWTDVYYQGEKIFKQFITSAISNEEVNFLEEAAVKLLMRFGKLKADYCFEHHDWVRDNNYGIVHVLTQNQFSTIKSSMVWYSEKTKEVRNSQFM